MSKKFASNLSFVLSVILKFLLTPKSKFTNFGPGIEPRPRFELHQSPEFTDAGQVTGPNWFGSRYTKALVPLTTFSLPTIASVTDPVPMNCGRSVNTPSLFGSAVLSYNPIGEPVL